ncbi:MAG: carbohydrate binding family 9 domain-containing protein [Planctomycetes bacterium]|nr:carbohydrate binding family 9 domain-containing protein [Planctomycetota bacterium]
MSARHLALVAAALAAVSPAQERARRTARVGRVDAAAAPSIDGVLDDPCWQQAPAIGDFVMVEPWQGRRPDQRTEIRLLHDRSNLYVYLYCYDDRPDLIRATQRWRDARLDPDDRVEFLFDPFENRRTGYFLQIGAGGSIGDALVSANGNRFEKPWDTVWRGRSRVVADGWVAELAIPFRSLPRRAGATSWGFNARRYLRTRNQEHQWANAVQNVPFFRISELGTIDGIGEIDAGIGLEVVPYVTVNVGRDRSVDPDWDVDPDAGGELYYRLTPSMTLAATLFTDFAQTENDGRQINFNRFPLFFPEKRDFFLRGSSYFEFGARSAGGTTFLPYFSRRVGLDGGEIVPMLGGVKLTGEVGPLEVGVLDVQTDSTAALDSENLGVARLKYAPGEQTTVGLIATNGDPSSATDNSVLGADLYHRWPEFVGDLDLQLTVDAVGSTGSGDTDDGESFGARLRSSGSELELDASVRWVSDDFAPALGFVRRRGSRASLVGVGYRPRFAEGGAIRRLDFDVAVDRQDEWDGTTQVQRFRIERLGATLHTGDSAWVYLRREFEFVDTDFTLFRGTTPVPRGDYWTSRVGATVHTSEARSWDVRLSASSGGFFGGTRDAVACEAKWRVSALLELGADYDVAFVDLGPGREFDAHIAAGRLDLHLSPALSVFTLVQFDNESENLGWQSRLRWIYSPGCDFFAVLGSSWRKQDDGALAPVEQALALKVSHSLRF